MSDNVSLPRMNKKNTNEILLVVTKNFLVLIEALCIEKQH